jgi:hypothetical protein
MIGQASSESTAPILAQTQTRVVMYGLGSMGSLVARMLDEHGAELVGAVARSPQKIGRDIGDVACLGKQLGVTIAKDIELVLADTRPDLVVMTIASYMEDMFEPAMACLVAGANVITLSEELMFSRRTSPDETELLDKAAREAGVTITGTGHQDGYWVNLVSVLMGTAHRIQRVVGKASWNVDDFGAELARDQQVGSSMAEFEQWLAGASRPPTFGRNALEQLAVVAGLNPRDASGETKPVIADADTECRALNTVIRKGSVLGFTDIDTLSTDEGVVLTIEMTGMVYGPDNADYNDWTIFGEPELNLRNEKVPTSWTTCATLVNRIPDVLSAPPGYVTLEALPQLRYRHPRRVSTDTTSVPSAEAFRGRTNGLR